MSAPDIGWGRLFRPHETVLSLRDRFDRPALSGGKSCLARGQGRSYGDVAVNDGGQILDTRRLDRWIDFDETYGTLECEAGVTLAAIIELCLPRGWFLPVTPGTRFVSIGGAIANDVHGKNHHGAGSFGRHVESFALLRSDGGLYHCSRHEHAQLFAASIGGLGLTGLILSARLQLMRVPGAAMRGDSLRFAALDDYFALSAESDRDWPYTVAWVDCTARGRRLGRGVFERARHEAADAGPAPQALRVPFTPPLSPLNALSLRTFNTLYYHRPTAQRRDVLWHYQRFFYPLDRLLAWNRLYGRRGFYQFQCLIPPAAACAAVGEMLKLIGAAGEGSCLAVLKTLGSLASPGLISFPAAGTTLALDFANRGETTRALLARLEAITLAAGGRLYPAKDACMSPQALRSGYPMLEAFARQIDPMFSSSFWRRMEYRCNAS